MGVRFSWAMIAGARLGSLAFATARLMYRSISGMPKTFGAGRDASEASSLSGWVGEVCIEGGMIEELISKPRHEPDVTLTEGIFTTAG
jgi:hypothetical protein